MRALAIIPALAIPLFSAIGSCVNSVQAAESASVEASAKDCAVVAAVAKEHFRFSAENPAPPLKGLGEPGWRPQCDWSKFGPAFTE